MSRPLRDTDPSKIHIITCRTMCAELLLVPSSRMNQIVGGVLAKYSSVHKVNLYAAIALSNHYHFLIQGAEGVIPRFAADVNREIAHRVNRMLGRHGPIWGRRYDDQVTVEVMDSLEALLYVSTNAVRHGLVSHPRHWPGVNCYRQILGEKPQKYLFFEYSKYHSAKLAAERRGDVVHRKDFEKEYLLEFKPLPVFSHLSDEERVEKVEELIEERTRTIQNERRRLGLGFLGRKAILQQPPQGCFPAEISNSPRPRCYTKSIEALRTFCEEEKAKREEYDEASFRFRGGDFYAEFPAFCIRPPLHYQTEQLHLTEN